jgi:hypothetical protein
MTAGRQLATRVMRARRPGTCPLCRGPIQVRESIAKIGFWAHTQCVIDRQHDGQEDHQ